MGGDEKDGYDGSRDLWREERTPTWLMLLPLVVVAASLLALVIVPPVITQRNVELREELTATYAPLSRRLSNLQRTTAAELSAARGYALTGDPFFVDRFLSVNQYGDQLSAEIDSLSALIGADVATSADRLVEVREKWTHANFGRTRADFREGLDEHQQHFEAVMAGIEEMFEVLGRAHQAQRERIQQAERTRSRVADFLALLALLAAGGAGWLALLLVRSERRMLHRARDETALRQIAQTMAEADDLREALDRIAQAVRRVSHAASVHVLQVSEDGSEVEVVASAGEGGPPVGQRTPYSESSIWSILEDAGVLGADHESETALAGGRVGLGSGARELAVPLISEHEPLGALCVTRAAGDAPFAGSEIYRTRLLADMAALVLRRLRLVDEIRLKEAQVRTFSEELIALNESLEQRVEARTRTVRQLSRELTLAEQRERQGIAQMLHDDLQQVLFALQLNAKSLETRAASLGDPGLTEGLEGLHTVAGEALAATRRLTADLSPPVRDGGSFQESLRWLAAHAHERFGLTIELRESTLSDGTISDDIRLLLFQVVRELVFNVVKHAGTDQAVIELSESNNELVVDVIDEGQGFAPEEEVVRASTIGGFGLKRARERLALFDGRIELRSQPGEGTCARVAVPLQNLHGQKDAG